MSMIYKCIYCREHTLKKKLSSFTCTQVKDFKYFYQTWGSLFDIICLHSQIVVIISHYSFTRKNLMVSSIAIQQ